MYNGNIQGRVTNASVIRVFHMGINFVEVQKSGNCVNCIYVKVCGEDDNIRYNVFLVHDTDQGIDIGRIHVTFNDVYEAACIPETDSRRLTVINVVTN